MNERTTQAAELAAELAPLLPGGPWAVEQRAGYAGATLRRADGAGMTLRIGPIPGDVGAGRVVVRTDYPDPYGRHGYDHAERPQIGAAVNRGVQAIAGDIARRFLPSFEEFAQKAATYNDREKRCAAKLDEVTRRLGLYGFRAGPSFLTDTATRRHLTTDALPTIRVECHDGETIRTSIERGFSLSVDALLTLHEATRRDPVQGELG